MIGQRDNLINMKMAELSRQDNAAMKQVALLTRKDSTDMRIIAWVTLVFLPGTFTATFFSSTFFDFLPGNETQIVSWWIWLYCIVTVVITVAVLVAWYRWSRKYNRRTLEDIENVKVDQQEQAAVLEGGIDGTWSSLGSKR